MSTRAVASGELVRRALAGAWRSAPPPLELSAAQLEKAAPLLIATGSGALVWRRVHGSPLEKTAEAEALRGAYRLHALHASVRERALAEALAALAAAGIEALLLKGWLAARLYPEIGLRPYSDHDLCVRPADLPAARAALAAVDVRVDLHAGLRGAGRGHGAWLERSFDELLASSAPVEIGGVRGRTLGAEDHLTVLCLHSLAHGVWRPIWLCDVAAALEARSTDWEWQRCLDSAGAKRMWLGAAFSLAQTLLGASLDGAPERLVRQQPHWLEQAVLARWGTHPDAVAGVGGPRDDMLAVRTRGELVFALRARWPGPIETSFAAGFAPTRTPRLPLQLVEFARRALVFALRLRLKLQKERRRVARSRFADGFAVGP